MRKIATRLLEQGARLRRRSSGRDDWRNRIHADHTQRTATETVVGNSTRDADHMSNDVPAAIPAAGQVKSNVSVDETILTDEAVAMMRTPVLRLVGVDRGRSTDERQHNSCPIEIGNDDDASAALSENQEPASKDATRELEGVGTIGEATPRSKYFGCGGGGGSSGEGGGAWSRDCTESITENIGACFKGRAVEWVSVGALVSASGGVCECVR
jgi:hypothetical protein